MNTINQYEHTNKFVDFPVTLGVWDSHNGFLAHWHEHIELLFFLTDAKITLDDTVYELEANDLLFINPNTVHSSQDHERPIRFYTLRIKPSLFIDMDFEAYPVKTVIRNDEYVKKCIEEIHCEIDSQKQFFQTRVLGLIYELMVHIVRNYKDVLSSTDIIIKEAKGHKIVKILDYITKHYSAKINTAYISSIFHLNEQYFCRMFKKETGMSFTNYLNMLRIEKAVIFLKNTDLNMTEIAENVGFDNSNYFTRVFKNHMHMTPREYKKSFVKHF